MPERSSFQRRLVVHLGAALAGALLFVGIAVWVSVAAWAAHEARRVLRAEAVAMQNASVGADGTLDADRYDWDEPHHRYDAPRIDPIFLQVFDAEGRLLRQSDNVAHFDAYPEHLLPSTEGDGSFVPLATLQLGDETLYGITEPLRDGEGRPVGFVQAARFPPQVYSDLGRLALGLALGFGSLLVLLVGLVWTVGGRVVRPLQAITAHAAGLSAATLDERIPIPENADREATALASALNDSLDRLDSAFTEMKRFTANAAHELQTPLTVLRGHVEVALRRERDPDAYRDTLRLLGSEVDGMVRTVRGLLALARLDADAAPLRTEPVDLAALAHAEAEAVRAWADDKGLTLTVRAEHPAVANGHPDLLREALRTLIDNAIKYTPEGQVTLEVSTRGDETWASVEDSGPGLSEAHRQLATGRFWRADDVHHLPGSGLGLALADRVARIHGGRLVLSEATPSGLHAALIVPMASSP